MLVSMGMIQPNLYMGNGYLYNYIFSPFKTGCLEFQDIRYGDMSMRLPRALSPAALRDLQVPKA